MDMEMLNGHSCAENPENLENGVEGEEVTVNEENCASKASNGNVEDIRIKKKAKRLMKQFNKEMTWNNHGGSWVGVPSRNWKNTRRPRNGFGRENGIQLRGGHFYFYFLFYFYFCFFVLFCFHGRK
ncbi:hypothetical protein Phum_PHUM173050 [Pediculus humanus corporis]|uniref:Transmembrane protein n=1 Tax=Pediculus humanus subsp. corporis TaxID=121224 RepID=E0VG42_PEDHC|nr:uncharacterized protein Phum_PHUM173050 [Pediculus humanus corporis]EEB12348.1 hypothetical protein Phum_PHUM173050 [Pediculus humanus corporis]